MPLTIAALGAAAVLTLTAALRPSPAAAGDAAPVRPNVVFILADDLGYGELGSYGQQKIRTPSLDRLAAEGMRFTQHYAGNAVCAPSRAVLLTGRHPGHNPIRDNREVQPEGQWPLPAPELTMAEVFRGRGYATAAMGKWGLGPPGSEGDALSQGFDHFFGYNCQRHAHGHYPSYLYDDARRIPLDNPDRSPHQKLAESADPLDQRSYAAYSGNVYAPDRIWERARGFIRDNRDRPFFLYLPTSVPHLALQVPEDSLAEYRGLWPDPPYRGDQSYIPHPSPRAAYAAMVTRMDREVGRILDLVRELGLAERTILVFTSDNGPTYDRIGGSDSEFFRSAGSLRGLKGSLYEGGVRVPAIVSWQGRVAKGAVSDRVTGFEDWLPTLVELTGAGSVAPGIDGVSFAPTLRGAAQEPRAFLYREFAGYGGQQTVRVGDWKAVRQGLGKPVAPRLELYDLATDASESQDVAARHLVVAARLQAVLDREHVASATFPLAAIDPAPPRYVARRTAEVPEALLADSDARWADAERIRWGPESVATAFRALWSDAGLAVRYDVTDASPWSTLTKFDERLWTEEVVELFLDVGATGRSYAELEWNPAGTVVDLWVDRAENRFDKEWNATGFASRVHPRQDASGRTSGWTALGFLPWSALAAKALPATALPPKPGDRWRFNVYRIDRPFGPGEPERNVHYLAWSPTGERSFHAPAAFREIEFAEAKGGPALLPLPADAKEPRASSVCHEETRMAMGSAATVRACGPEASALAELVSAALDEVDRVDRLMSHYRADSPLSRLNREAAGGPVAVEPELLDFLALCLRWSRESEGAFDVTVGPLMKAWGFFRDEGRLPKEREIRSALERVGFQHVVLDREHATVRFDRPGVELDLGGIGKGYAVDRVVELLRRRGVTSALVNLGGSSVYGLGTPPGAEAWEVGVQDPTDAGKAALTVELRDRALSVSGGYARSFEEDGVRYSHIMDPRTGRPVSGILSVAVLSASATDGDALDNVLFVLGVERAEPVLKRHPHTEALYFLGSPGRRWTLRRLPGV